ncbi:MAG TPA: class I SAM-dependent methyltransferase [Candidatus Acidoferrales bacterium]
MPQSGGINLWSTAEHSLDYLRRADSIPHRSEGESVLIEFVPVSAKTILDLGTGAGRLISLLKPLRPAAEFVGLDFSPTMLAAARDAFRNDRSVTIVAHDFDAPLPLMGRFDAVISSFAIHHLIHERKRALYQQIFEILAPNGVFCNLEHVASVSPRMHAQFLEAISTPDEDPSNKLLDLETQLRWLREIGFDDVDCHWKWRELALFAGVKPA